VTLSYTHAKDADLQMAIAAEDARVLAAINSSDHPEDPLPAPTARHPVDTSRSSWPLAALPRSCAAVDSDSEVPPALPNLLPQATEPHAPGMTTGGARHEQGSCCGSAASPSQQLGGSTGTASGCTPLLLPTAHYATPALARSLHPSVVPGASSRLVEGSQLLQLSCPCPNVMDRDSSDWVQRLRDRDAALQGLIASSDLAIVRAYKSSDQ
jgi:hypothetical protein